MGVGRCLSAEGLVEIFTESEDGEIRLEVETCDAPPENVDLDGWEDVFEVSIRSSAGGLTVRPFPGGEPPGWCHRIAENGAGSYRMRCHLGAGSAGEEHRIIVWPGPHEPYAAHKRKTREVPAVQQFPSGTPPGAGTVEPGVRTRRGGRHQPSPGLGWTALHPTFTFTATLGRTPYHVLAAYGADPGRARLLTRDEVHGKDMDSEGGTLLRAGMLAEWAFCFEDGEPEGIKDRVLCDLSTGTETLTVFHGGDGMDVFQHFADGREVESFEPGMRTTERGEAPRGFARKVDDRLEAGRVTDSVAALEVLADHVGAVPDRTLLDGPLLTVFLPDSRRHREPPPLPVTGPDRSRLGRCLGPVHPSPRPPQEAESATWWPPPDEWT